MQYDNHYYRNLLLPLRLLPHQTFFYPGYKMLQPRGTFLLLNIALSTFAGFALFVNSCNAGELFEIESFFNFIRALDPENVLRIGWNQSVLPHPCSHQYWSGVECSKKAHSPAPSITAIRLQNLNLSGTLDAESLCRLPSLLVLNLANNQIQGTVPECIANCNSLVHLDISGNLFRGSPPVALTKMKNLKTLDITNNYFDTDDPDLHSQSRFIGRHRILSDASDTESGNKKSGGRSYPNHAIIWILVAMVVIFILLLAFFMKLRSVQAAKYRDPTALSPLKSPPVKIVEEVKAEERHSELVFFVEEQERFGLEELLEATAHLHSRRLCSSLYKVRLKNNAIFAVKRLKKLQVSFEDFGQTMRKIGNLKHPNLRFLVGYNSSDENKLLFYRYQRNGSLLSLLENHIEGKRNFPWKLRLSIAVGIARGLKFIYQWPDDGETIPHGNIKPSNILLNENLEPLISEYGFSKFLDVTKARLFTSSSYRASEKCLTELADVYSFGVIMLELLTGKIAEKHKQEKGLDLPKWVKAKVREEWTGEVFDKEMSKVEMYGFPLLNISLKCVSKLPHDRPSISEVLEKVEEVVNAQEDINSSTSYESD